MSGKNGETKLLEARIGVLESQVKFLLQLNGVELSALREAPDQLLLTHYQDAAQLIGLPASKVANEVIERWGELFIQLSELEFTRLQGLVEYDHTWEPFYDLCLRFQTQLRQRKEFQVDPLSRELYALLDRGRRNLRAAAVIMLQKNPQTLPFRARVLLQPDLPL